MPENSESNSNITISIGHDELLIRNRYETLSIANDFMIGILFLIGSFFFFYPSMETAGVWLFVIGSAELLIRPVIRLARNIHLQKLPSNSWDM